MRQQIPPSHMTSRDSFVYGEMKGNAAAIRNLRVSLQETIVCTLLFVVGGLITYQIQIRQKWSLPMRVLIFVPGLLLAQMYSFAISAPGDLFVGRVMATDQTTFYGFPISFSWIPAWERPAFFISFIFFLLTLMIVLGLLYFPRDELSPADARLLAWPILIISGLFFIFSLIIAIWGTDWWSFVRSNPTWPDWYLKSSLRDSSISIMLGIMGVAAYRVVRHRVRLAAAVLFLQLLVLEPFLRWVAVLNRGIAAVIIFCTTLAIINLIGQASPELQTFIVNWSQRIRGRNSHPLV